MTSQNYNNDNVIHVLLEAENRIVAYRQAIAKTEDCRVNVATILANLENARQELAEAEAEKNTAYAEICGFFSSVSANFIGGNDANKPIVSDEPVVITENVVVAAEIAEIAEVAEIAEIAAEVAEVAEIAEIAAEVAEVAEIAAEVAEIAAEVAEVAEVAVENGGETTALMTESQTEAVEPSVYESASQFNNNEKPEAATLFNDTNPAQLQPKRRGRKPGSKNKKTLEALAATHNVSTTSIIDASEVPTYNEGAEPRKDTADLNGGIAEEVTSNVMTAPATTEDPEAIIPEMPNVFNITEDAPSENGKCEISTNVNELVYQADSDVGDIGDDGMVTARDEDATLAAILAESDPDLDDDNTTTVAIDRPEKYVPPSFLNRR